MFCLPAAHLCIMTPDAAALYDIITVKMPFGKYKDRPLYLLPVSYLEWFQREGFPAGRLGMLLETLVVIKTNGLEYLLQPIIPDDQHGIR
jgi:uncharacterized protein